MAVVLVTALLGFGQGIVWAFVGGLTANLLLLDPLGTLPLTLLLVSAMVAGGSRLLGRLVWVYPMLAAFAGSVLADLLKLGHLPPGRRPAGRRPAAATVIPAAFLNAAILALILYPARVDDGQDGARGEPGMVIDVADLNEGRLDLARSRARFIAFAVTAALLLTILGGRLFQLQVVNGDEYAAQATRARTIEVPIRAPRGLVFDREGRALVVNVPSWTVKIRPADLPERGTGSAPAAPRDADGRRSARHAPAARRLPGIAVRPRSRWSGASAARRRCSSARSPRRCPACGGGGPVRRYLDEEGNPDGTLLSHILGYTGPINLDEFRSLDGQGYLRDDVIGRSGVEASYEEALRGTLRIAAVGARCLRTGSEGVDTVSEPVAGKNLMLTIDAGCSASRPTRCCGACRRPASSRA